ncbi:MAG: stage V sporulation protein AD, partial [Firmicutes bacterium]|nr:stage V sporulation protein AD [Bacillota bacterium]
NMGAAMAPAAFNTLSALFADTNTYPENYDAIFTGDLGKMGSDILRDLMVKQGNDLGKNYYDCGSLVYDKTQHAYQGGSGCGCGAIVLNSYIINKLKTGEYKKVIFCATGALLSPTSSNQGDTIPCIAHAIVIERE